MKNLFRISIVTIPTLLVVGYFFLQWPYVTSCCVSNRFIVNEDFDVVRKTLVRTPAKYKILEANGATVIEQKWDNLSLGLDRIINPNWMVDGSSVIKLNVKNPHWGQRVMIVKQIINITPDKMLITVVLLRPVEELKSYKMVLDLGRYGDRTVVDVKLVMGIEVNAPHTQSVHDLINNRLKKAANETIVANQESIISNVEKYKGKTFLDLTRRMNGEGRPARKFKVR